jgi:hypothetical protein
MVAIQVRYHARRQRLVRAALPDWALKAGPVDISEYSVASEPDFYFFLASRDNPGGSGTVGHFVVHRLTGDVWDGVVCAEHKTAALVKLQVSIRKKLGLRDADYPKLRRKGPFCDPE